MKLYIQKLNKNVQDRQTEEEKLGNTNVVAYSLLLLLFNGFDQHKMMAFSFSFLKINIFNILKI